MFSFEFHWIKWLPLNRAPRKNSQLDKPRLCLVATDRVHVNIAVIINAIVLHIFAFMYLLEIKLLLLQQCKLNGLPSINIFEKKSIGDKIFKCIFLREKFSILTQMSLQYAPKGPIDIKQSLVNTTSGNGLLPHGTKPLPEPILTSH